MPQSWSPAGSAKFLSRFLRLVDDVAAPAGADAGAGDLALRRVTHHVIHDAIEAVDHALVAHLTHPDDFAPLQQAIDLLTDTLLSHLAYEERELLHPLARHGFYR